MAYCVICCLFCGVQTHSLNPHRSFPCPPYSKVENLNANFKNASKHIPLNAAASQFICR